MDHMPHFLSSQDLVSDIPQYLVVHSHPHKEALVDLVKKKMTVCIFAQSSDHIKIQQRKLKGKPQEMLPL